MTFRYFLKIHLLFCALLFSCNIFSSPLISPSTGSTLSQGSQIDWSDTDVGSDYWVYVGTSPGARNLLDSGNIFNQMSFIVGDWAGEFFVRLWYRPVGLPWAFVDTSFINVSCPAPVRELYDMVKTRIDNGVLVAKEGQPFDGLGCWVIYGPVGDDDTEFNTELAVVVVGEPGFGDPFHPNVVPASVRTNGFTLWMTQGEARACVNYIECDN